ncbi:hypothetical protein GN958_ATG03127 [Phytophthora infestans]|uniref:Uncharacterized protein n=1 Tax=Phytophthora infestans TaxID=4787 RepID=A0A8S9V8Q7_PHYIN|nr:hypothetical protein GN958_ATG09620 [Phytophthora infestans]KAF4147772.1 hypothetical protein GN958_ATG03127 [Phytophthora infestans]
MSALEVLLLGEHVSMEQLSSRAMLIAYGVPPALISKVRRGNRVHIYQKARVFQFELLERVSTLDRNRNRGNGIAGE